MKISRFASPIGRFIAATAFVLLLLAGLLITIGAPRSFADEEIPVELEQVIIFACLTPTSPAYPWENKGNDPYPVATSICAKNYLPIVINPVDPNATPLPPTATPTPTPTPTPSPTPTPTATPVAYP